MKKSIIISLSILLISCGATSGGDCEPYTEWKPTEEKCDNNFWCFGKNQKATYQYFERSRQCKNGIVKDTKREKIKCGC